MRRILFFVSLNIVVFNSIAQLSVTTGLNAQQLSNILAGYNIQVTNASVTGNSLQRGSFQYTGTGLGVNSGVFLSTGNVLSAQSQNSSDFASSSFSGPGNPLLTNLAGFGTYDASVLQFQFQVQSDRIEFKYIFLSEEYNEFVNSGYNDVFAFYISGPGIVGEENLAVVPGTTTPVTINTINNGSFWQFYRDNTAGGTNIIFDGFTTLMTARKTGLIPCQTYTLKLMIADGSDYSFDSGVLLQENSLIQANVSASANTFSDNDIALEGCIQANFTFQLDSAMNQNTSIPIGIGGSAINGVDYDHIDTLIIIPAGQTSATLIIDAIADGIPEGTETIEIYYSTGPCMPLDTVTLYIDDYNLIEFTTTPSNATCNGAANGLVDINVSGGLPPYYVTLTDSATGLSTQYTTIPVTGLNAATYYVNVMDGYGCVAEDIVSGAMFSGGAVFLPDGNGMSYSTSLTLSGFAPGQTLANINQLQSICMNMEHSFMGDLEIILQAPNGTQIELKHQPGGSKTNLGEPVATGSNDTHSWDTTPGVGYDYCFTPNPTYGTMISEANNHHYTYITTQGFTETDSYLPSGSYQSQQPLTDLIGVPLNGQWTLIITDEIPNNNGYVFNWSISLTAEPPDSIVTIAQPSQPIVTNVNTLPDCGLNNGAINITVNGISGPYTYQWSNGPTTEDITGLTSGTYTVTITGTDNCSYTRTYNLSNNGTLALSGNVYPVSCIGNNDGSINLTVSGGTSPFSFLWSNSESTEDISGLSNGNYIVTVTDIAGCNGIMSFNVTQLLPITVNAIVTNENCGDQEGIINTTVTGGSNAYTYQWSNNSTTEDITDLTQGNYTVTVTDSNNCSSTGTWTVTNYVGNCIPNCDINITNAITNDEICGNGAGYIDLTVFTSFSPYNVEWSNGSTTDDIYMLHNGSYSVTITDAESCQLISNFSISNQTGTLNVSNVSVTNETCGNNNGSVNITVNGGALPYSFLWSNGATTQNLSGIHQGHYYLTITDANGCNTFLDAVVSNISGTLIQTFGNVVNEVCGNGSGSIDIQISGGTFPYTYAWSSGVTTQDLLNIGAGIYTCTITDASGCKLFTPNYTVLNEAGTLALGYTDVDDEICNNNAGGIHISVSGGNLPYTFSWSNGSTNEDLFNLSAGTYSCTITDNSGCQIITPLYNVTNSPGTLALTNISTIDELCHNSGGSINITITGGSSPISYLWNNNVASEDLLNIPSGNYSCTITDANSCQITVNTTIDDLQGTLTVSNTIITNESCGNSNGQINIITAGGTAPYTYNWSNGQTTEDIAGLSSGTYVITITDAQGCVYSQASNVMNLTGTLTLGNTVITNEICSGSNGSINITVTGTQTPISYLWTNSSTNQDILNLTAGIYTCTVTDNSGCEIIAGPFTVNNSAPGMVVALDSIIHENCGNGTGSVNISISGGVFPITYLWNNAATTQDISNLIAGTYTVTISDANNCEVIRTYIVNNNSGTLAISGAIVQNEICSNNSGSIDITVSGGTSPYTYSWTNSSITQDLNGIHDGIYNVTITDANLCSVISPNYIVSNNPGTFAVSNTIISNEICGNNSGSINISITGATMPVFYNWSNGAITQDIIGLATGNYSCTATDNIGCELVIYATVQNESGTLDISNAIASYTTCNEGSGFVDLTVTGGTMPYSFLWSNSETTEDISNLYSGTYTCLVTDDSGCSVSHTEILNPIVSPVSIVNPIITHDQCELHLGSINISVSGGLAPYSYLWSNGAVSQDIINLTSGNYLVTVTDGNGCNTLGNYTITDNSNFTLVSANVTNEYCSNNQGGINISVSGGINPILYVWSNNSTDQDIFNLPAGTYFVTITDGVGCNITDTFMVTNITNGLQVMNSAVVNDSCSQGLGSIDITISGGTPPYSYLWNNSYVTEDLVDLSEGNYICSITDNTGCLIVINESVYNTTNGLIIQNSAVTNDSCNNFTGAVNLVVTGGGLPYTYIWNNGAQTEDISGVTAGIYEVTITDNTGCSIISQFDISNMSNPFLGFQDILVTGESCGNGQGSISFNPLINGTYTYLLNGHPGGQPIHVFNNLSSGDYILSIWQGTCSFDTLVNVNNITSFVSSVGLAGDDYCGLNNGFIDLITIPNGNYTYEWSNNVFTEDNYNIGAGTYTCTISDNAGCYSYISVMISNSSTMSVTSEIINENCGNSNGIINLTLTGDTTGVVFNWSNGSAVQNQSGLSAGLYSCTLTNSSNCQEIINVEIINEISNFNVISQITDDFCGEGQGQIYIQTIGDPGPYSFLWNTGANTDSLISLTYGNYSLTVTNLSTNCSYHNNYSVGNSGLFTVSGNVTPASCSNCATGSINIMVNGVSPNYTYTWSNGATTQNLDLIVPGVYYVTIQDDWGCLVTDSFNVGFYTTSIQEDIIEYIKVYPNPSHGIFNIDYDLRRTIVGPFEIIDLTGKIVKTIKISERKDNIRIDMQEFPKGMYLIKQNYLDKLFIFKISIN